MSSPPPIRRRVGLGQRVGDPRAARAQASEAESHRLELQQRADEQGNRRVFQEIVRQGSMGLDIPSDGENYDEEREFNLDTSDSEDYPRARPREAPHLPPQPAQAPAAAQMSARSRQLWQGNHAKLNIMSSLYLLQPVRQEMIANASQDPESIAVIRQIKRDPSRDLGHDNLKHAGKKFIIEKTCEELNDHSIFAQFLPANSRIGAELLRQKIREFQEIAVNSVEEEIDRSNFLI